MTTLEIALLIIVVVLTMVLLGLVYIIKEYSDKLRATRGLVKRLSITVRWGIEVPNLAI